MNSHILSKLSKDITITVSNFQMRSLKESIKIVIYQGKLRIDELTNLFDIARSILNMESKSAFKLLRSSKQSLMNKKDVAKSYYRSYQTYTIMSLSLNPNKARHIICRRLYNLRIKLKVYIFQMLNSNLCRLDFHRLDSLLMITNLPV